MNALTPLIGRPWAVPCDPPSTFDCWELVRYVRGLRGITTPSVVNIGDRKPTDRKFFKNKPNGWYELMAPHPYCVVFFGVSHVGVYLTVGQIMHAQLGAGVCINRPEHILGEATYWDYHDPD